MMNSKVKVVAVAAVCDRRRTDPKNPTAYCSVAAFVRKPQTDSVTQTLRSPRQSSQIKPNQAIPCREAIQTQPPTPSTPSTPSMSSARSIKSAIRPDESGQSAIPLGSTWFHLIPLNSTSGTPCGHAHDIAPAIKPAPICARSRPANDPFSAPFSTIPMKVNEGQ
jgi:hypothetical protein